METLLDKFKRDQGGLRRSRSVRASLRLIGNRWRSTKDEETSENIDTIKDGNVVLTQIFNGDKDYNVAYTGIDGTYKAKTPNMAKRKQEPVKPRKKSGDIDLTLKPQRHRKVDKAKISDLFNKKQKSVSAKELLVPEKIPPKAAAILHINSPDTKLKIKLKSVGKSESAKSVTDIKHRRTRRGSESDMCGSQPRGFVNQAFVYSTPPKERKLNLSPSSYLTLFAAVEHGYLDKARNILESTDVDVNSLNPDGLSPLDVAVLANNRHLVRMLMEFGAKEGSQFKSPEALGNHLRRLSREAEARLHEVTGYIPEACREEMCRSSGGNQAGTMGCAGGTGSEKDKQTQHWERRLRTLKRLVQGWQQARVPPALPSPSLEVCGPHSVTVWLATRTQARDPPLVTKYKVEWSSRADFSNVCGSREVVASCARVSVTGLTRGRRYFFRAAAGNVKGWGTYSVSVPRSVVPSSWSDISVRSSRGEAGGAAAALEALAAATASTRTRTVTRLPRKKTATIRQLFTAASKFQKNLRRGVYLTCIIYHEDRVLVTGEEFLPVVEVDETYPACIYTDFHWLMKVSCSWEEVKSLRSDMEKHTSSSIHFRLKLLTAVAQMQSALGIQDLGQLYHKPLRDSHGTVVLSCITSVKSPKAVSALNSRWLPVNKLRRRVLSDDNTMGELLMASVHEQIAYHQVSRDLLPRGLYLGYLKLQSSVEVVRIVAPSRTPNVPPHTRVRDNPHVSAEEWEYLKSQSGRSNNYMGSNSQFDIKSNGSHASISSNRLPPSRSEDTLVLQNENIEPKPRPHSINTSVSTSSSPLLTVKGFYPGSMISVKTNKTNVSESAQSLSSDSESQSCPLTTTVPLKIRPQLTHANVTASKSMTNVKSTDVEFTDTGQGSKGHSVKRQPLLETQEEEYNNKVQKTDQRHSDDDRKLPPEQRIDQAGILQVFAAYETGLAVGTSLKLHVTPRTSAREVIDLVVKQLNMAAVLKGKSGPVYGPEKLQDFCLVAVIGARERCLRDDFRPLQLQNPWRKGRLYVRLKHDVLAALQHSAKQPAYI
ncbi:hypothetical protein KGM_210801 [Danaus plexippus plexippus]|uniref:Ankyrin repeat and fibronectin type-III domain-containing protein 1 n=1 Tax=Danaus plexippus plexippus TaxID=278856 RepID=A0A212FHP0_DANPL|nr:hypothetical protein KGM_210801 [Danaus plexippus plexippus]